MNQTFKIQIQGRVQGVGFRPFIFNRANAHQLTGTVSNNESGVIIFCNASKHKAAQFLEDIQKNKPEMAIITSHALAKVSFVDYDNFAIVPSQANAKINIPLTPDFAICTACKIDIADPNNRRFRYAFTTCINCGPRYAITEKFPFERPHTAMRHFKMCSDCVSEYENPADRRFHSQTNSCDTCGIQLELTNQLGEIVSNNQDNIITKTVHLLRSGNIIALKNTSGYLLCCDASNPKAIQTLRERKQRPNKPFAVVYPSMKTIQNDFKGSSLEQQALQSAVAPIVILQNTKNTSIATHAIAPNIDQTGVMLPSTALLELIVQEFQQPIVATSGNIHGSPIISENETAQQQLQSIADYFVHHNLNIQFPQDDSVLKFSNTEQLIIRRSRGIAPNYIDADIHTEKTILAMGAHLKSTFAFVPNNQVYVSQYFGNLDSYEVLQRYEICIQQYIQLFDSKPEIILVDKHAQYQSSILGKELATKYNTELLEIQHHKAHFASVLGEHRLFDSEEKILGVIWDGTGLGDDNTIWGGEFFMYQDQKIARLTHVQQYDWLANDNMAKEPRLALFSLLDDSYRTAIQDKFSKTEWKVYSKMIRSNTLKTSSVGRLFDAVASALDIVDTNTFEAEAAMRLENCTAMLPNAECIDLLEFAEYEQIPSKLLLKIILKAYKEDGVSKAFIARSFIYTLAKSIINIAHKNQFKIIACSGGVFQNALLVSMLHTLAEKAEITIKLNRKLSGNDENISFGQLMYYQNITTKNQKN
ncbi:MAG: carbamoyltransferase HypF [Bacteroidota bacterium]